MSRTKISWTDHVCNPFPGCRKVSPGCQNCYAERMARRLKGMGVPAYQDVVDEGGWTGKVGWQPSVLDIPGKGKLVFVNSMGDVFYEGISAVAFAELIVSIEEQPQHIFQLLTKRPAAAKKWLAALPLPPNCWLGVTAENQEWADQRIPLLLQIPVAVRFVSLEPLLSSIDLSRRLGSDSRPTLDLVIVGPETGPGRRPCDNEWIRSIVEQCHAAQVPVFVKAATRHGRPTKKIDQISDLLGFPPESLRQFPAGRNRNQITA